MVANGCGCRPRAIHADHLRAALARNSWHTARSQPSACARDQYIHAHDCSVTHTSRPTARINSSALLRSPLPAAGDSRNESRRSRCDPRNGRYAPARPASAAISASARSCVVTRPIAPRSTRPLHHRRRADAPVVRVGAAQQFIQQEQRRLPRARQIHDVPQPADLGVESRSMIRQRIVRCASTRRCAAATPACARRTPERPPRPAPCSSPMARSSVLLPDMFDPLTIHNRTLAADLDIVRDRAISGGINGWLNAVRIE